MDDTINYNSKGLSAVDRLKDRFYYVDVGAFYLEYRASTDSEFLEDYLDNMFIPNKFMKCCEPLFGDRHFVNVMDNSGKEWCLKVGWIYGGCLTFYGEEWNDLLRYFNVKHGDLIFFATLLLCKTLYVKKFDSNGAFHQVGAIPQHTFFTRNYDRVVDIDYVPEFVIKFEDPLTIPGDLEWLFVDKIPSTYMMKTPTGRTVNSRYYVFDGKYEVTCDWEKFLDGIRIPEIAYITVLFDYENTLCVTPYYKDRCSVFLPVGDME